MFHPQQRDMQEQIDRLEERLRTVERELATSRGSVSNQSLASNELTTENEGDSPRFHRPNKTAHVYKGRPSSITESAEASDAAQRAMSSEGTGDLALSHSKTFRESRNMAASSEDYRFSRPSTSGARSPGPLPLPAILQEIKENRPIFLCSYAINDPLLVERLCRKVYFATGPISSGAVAGAYGVLYLLLKEFIIMENPLCQSYDLKMHAAHCGQRFNAAIETYDVLAVPSFENILALIMGFAKAQDEGKPLLCYTLISAAASHCQMLEYQHERIYHDDKTEDGPENMRRLFWTTYVFEKQICFLFGRASRIQDFDIDVQYPALSTDPAFRPWDESFILGIKLAKIQGQIYEKLYSTAALKSSNSERAKRAAEIETAMRQWRAELQEIDADRVNNHEVFNFSRGNWDLMYFSTLTALLRAPDTSVIEGREISGVCFHFARLALDSHLRCFGSYQTSEFSSDTNYANWVLLFSSVTPFLIIFLHAIATTSPEDIQLLNDVVETLRNVRQISNSSERLYQIYAIFARIARGLAETEKSCVGTYNEYIDSLKLVNDGQESILEPEYLQSLLETEMKPENHDTSSLDAHDLSAMFDSWVAALPIKMTLFGGS